MFAGCIKCQMFLRYSQMIVCPSPRMESSHRFHKATRTRLILASHVFFLSIGFSEADTPLTLLAQSHYVLLMKSWGSWSSSGVCEGRVLTGVAVLADSLKFGEEEAPYKSPESLLLSRLSSKVLLGS